jgi:hypothetical protein
MAEGCHVVLGRVCAVARDDKHPVLAGLAALVAVAVVVGVIVGVVAMVASHVLGTGTTASSSGVDGGASLYLPTPSPTATASGPLITLSAQPGQSSPAGGASSSSAPPSESPSTKPGINLTASTTSASTMEQFTLSGTFPDGEGQILRVQRKTPGGGWTDFGIPDVDVQGGVFSEPVQTSRGGVNLFRVIDVDTQKASNTVQVTIQ